MKFKGESYSWIPTLYFAEGVPNAIITTVSVVILKNLGMDNALLIFYTSLLALPWVFKPFWAPLIDMIGTKRNWILGTQFLLGGLFAAAALVCPVSFAPVLLIAVFLLAGFTSATHDAAADGYYIIAQKPHEQALYSGLRNAFYRVAMLAAQGGLVVFAGVLIERGLGAGQAWMFCLLLPGVLFLGLGFYHMIVIPRSTGDQAKQARFSENLPEFFRIFLCFFRKKQILAALLFLLLFRFAEAQLTKVSTTFLLDPRDVGGLALSNAQQGLLCGTFGLIAMMSGGIIAGFLVARHGIGRWLWPMALAINVPDLVYVYMAWVQPENLWVVGSCLFVEQFGYGFGFSAFMLFMVYYAGSSGDFKTSHYALMTGLMALGLMLPGMVSGYILEKIPLIAGFVGKYFSGQTHFGSYQLFFLWIVLCTLPGFAVTWLISKIMPSDFGKRASSEI